MSEERIVVVGAGLTGLSVAARLARSGKSVVVFDRALRPGGQIHTFRQDKLIIELGAEGFVARSQAVPALCLMLGMEHALVDQLTTDTYALEAGQLVLLPPGEAARRLGFQVPVEELGRGIRSLALGMGQLIDALVAELGAARLRLGQGVKALRRPGAELELELGDGRVERAGAVVLALPARPAAALLSSLELAEVAALSSAPLLSNVSVNLLFGREQFADYPAGSGIIFPDGVSQVGLRALSLVDHKFAGRVGPEQALLRVFFRPVVDALGDWQDSRFVSEAVRAIGQVLPLTGLPEQTWVSRWADALPVFTPEYKAQAAAADAALARQGIHLAGSAFHGAGIDAAVASAATVAARLGASS